MVVFHHTPHSSSVSQRVGSLSLEFLLIKFGFLELEPLSLSIYLCGLLLFMLTRSYDDVFSLCLYVSKVFNVV